MIIGFTGPQCTGKSTLLSKMTYDEQYRKCSFVKEVTRKVAANGYKINESGDDITQLFILNEHLHNHHLAGCVVLDRCIIDGYIYTRWLYENNKVSHWVYEYSKQLHELLIDKVSLILFPDPDDVELVDDGQRSARVDFREQIKSLYVDYFKTYPCVKERTLTLSGSVDQRYKTIEKYLKYYDKTR